MTIPTPDPEPPGPLPLPIAEFMQSVADDLEAAQGRPRGIASGFKDLDGLTGGAVAGALWVIAGRSGVGKSVLALDLARSAAVRQDQSTLLVSGSEIPYAVMRRLLAAEARVPLHHMTAGTLSADDWERLSRRMGEVAQAPLMLVQPESLDPASVVQCLDAVRPLNVPAVRLLIVDALPADGTQPATLLSLRELARTRRLRVVVVVEEDVQRSDVQLRRIEQIADVVLRIHRDDQTDPESPRGGEADFRVSRHRHGPQATVVVAFQGHYSRFVDLPR